jgi:hypothetical protein
MTVEVRTYAELIAALRARMQELRATGTDIDTLGGLPLGYTNKLLGYRKVRTLSRVSFGALLAVLGLKAVLVEDEASWAHIKPRLIEARFARWDGSRRVHAGASMLAKRSKPFLRNSAWGRAMRARQVILQNDRKRSSVARAAASARWARPEARLLVAQRWIARRAATNAREYLPVAETTVAGPS